MSDTIVYYNGNINTMAKRVRTADSLAVCNGLIIAVGTETEVRSQIPLEAVWIDLAHRNVVPGFIDAHCHFTMGVFAHLWPDCSGERFDRLVEAPGKGWIRGRQLSYPFHYLSLIDFDALVPDRPAMIVEQGYHGSALNSVARQILGNGCNGAYFTTILNNPETRGASTLTNLPNIDTQPRNSSAVFETAMGWAENVSRDWFQEHYLAELLMASERRAQRFLANGVTCVCDAAVTPNMAQLLMQAQTAGRLPLSVVMLVVSASGFFEQPWDRFDGPSTGEGNETLRVGSLKLFADGGRQCLMEFPDGKIRGHAYYNHKNMASLIVEALHKDFSLACHAMGNAAVKLILDSYEAALNTASKTGKYPLRIEHAALLTPALIRRMADMGVIAVVQPSWIEWLGKRWIEAPYPHVRFLPFRALIDAGVTLAGSSDSTDGPICSPIDSMATAASRRVTAEQVLDEEQALTPEEALLLWTRNAAIACGILEKYGTLEVGKRADFIVLEGDPLSYDGLVSGQVKVLATYVGGDLVYDTTCRRF